MHIKCTNGTPTLDTLDHLPPLPLFIDYWYTMRGVSILTEKDELGIYHALRLHERIYHIDLILPPSILHKIFLQLDGHFPILEHLSLTFSAPTIDANLPPRLPKGFLAPNLHQLSLPGISPPRRLRVFTSTVSLVTLELRNIQTSSYFRPRLLVARLSFLPLLEALCIEFSAPIPRPSTERELLGEKGAPVKPPCLTKLEFRGVGAYLESLIAQIKVPLLERLWIALFNQITLALPHLSYLINITKVFKLRSAAVGFDFNDVFITTARDHSSGGGALLLRVICKPLDWQIDSAAQICHGFIPTLSCVEHLRLNHFYREIPTELRDGAIDTATWHELLRSFIGLKELYVDKRLLEELSRVLQADEVGLDQGFLPNLQSIVAEDNLFTSFIDARQLVARPVRFENWY